MSLRIRLRAKRRRARRAKRYARRRAHRNVLMEVISEYRPVLLEAMKGDDATIRMLELFREGVPIEKYRGFSWTKER